MSKKKILCIIGESGSGKTMVAEYLQAKYNMLLLESYTDRPQRYEGETGHTFVTPEEFDTFKAASMIAYTQFGDYRYCCLESDLKDVNVYVIDEDGFVMLNNKWGEQFEITSLRIHRDLSKRLQSVGEARVLRDNGRFNIADYDYDYVIHNSTDDKKEVFRFADYVASVVLNGRFYHSIKILESELAPYYNIYKGYNRKFEDSDEGRLANAQALDIEEALKVLEDLK